MGSLFTWVDPNFFDITVERFSLPHWRNNKPQTSFVKRLRKRRRGVVVITTARLHSTKPELRFCAGSNPGVSVSEIRDGEDLGQWSRLEIRVNAFRRSTIQPKQTIIIIITTITVLKPVYMIMWHHLIMMARR